MAYSDVQDMDMWLCMSMMRCPRSQECLSKNKYEANVRQRPWHLNVKWKKKKRRLNVQAQPR